MTLGSDKILLILYSSGGTPDVGRHAIRAALDMCSNPLRILTCNPDTILKETNWNCACDHEKQHTFTQEELARMDIRTVDFSTTNPKVWNDHLQNVGAVISALGNRQPLYGDRVGISGTNQLVDAMQNQNVQRIVAITSVGINDDWPPVEFHYLGNILKILFLTLSRSAYKDLAGVENILTSSSSSSLDYLIVRPMGLGEDRKPKNEWFVQKEKYKDKLGYDMSKLDCARFAVTEVLNPTYHKRAVVVGSNWEDFQ